ncbi:adenosylcobinamide-GDP ribazoletransferase [Natronoflexus pectinivorans]|uniref:Adenosylcobinamide-GDP ribazoletransferase n=1 Tax=Natronoflexus pectinivorans TaxID=682526 RepID=A0A4R2GI15_9BACT|nr:adenosylcobinamide-GDP ribazoletransferase [Natronoflexus pectinivorans]TCO08046.1 cobalamin-5'-phosphate synthase [Natronoflexus pectinivorans]
MNTLLTAIMFFTRIPVPTNLPYSKELLNKALRFFPLVGGIVGGVGAGVLWLALLVLPLPLALLLSIIATIFITGAFHEDGFADFCDGYGGGMTKERILDIMKDSRLGTYGTIGLVSVLAVKYTALLAIPIPYLFIILVSAHIFSRFVPVVLVFTTPYIREDALSKAKPIGNQTSVTSLIIAMLTSAIPLFFLNWIHSVGIIVACAIVIVLFRLYIMKRTGGYSGDVLGALQQLCEVAIYLVVVTLHVT